MTEIHTISATTSVPKTTDNIAHHIFIWNWHCVSAEAEMEAEVCAKLEGYLNQTLEPQITELIRGMIASHFGLGYCQPHERDHI